MRAPPLEVLKRWFAAHEAGDLGTARGLLSDRAVLRVGDSELRGFDEFMAWCAQRRQEQGPAFACAVLDLMGGSNHAAAVIRLTEGTVAWRQVAVFEIGDGLITGMVAYEDGPLP